MPSTAPPPPRVDVSALENSLVVVRFEGARDVFITVPLGREKRICISQTSVDHERSQVVVVPAGSAVTVHTPHHGDILIPTILPLGGVRAVVRPADGDAGCCRLPPFEELVRVAMMHTPPPPPLPRMVPTPSVAPMPAAPSCVAVKQLDPLTAERLDVTRRGREMWQERSKQIEADYRALIEATPCCPLCGAACASCPHYGALAVDRWLGQNTYHNKARSMTFNLLSLELRGVIQTRRAGGDNTFMGIARFLIPKNRRAEFNRKALVPEWWGLPCTDPASKGAVESWRSLGWSSMVFDNCDGVVMFVYSPVLRRAKLSCIAVAKRAKAEAKKRGAADSSSSRTLYSREFSEVKRVLLHAAIRDEADTFGAAAANDPEGTLIRAVRLVRGRG